MHIQSKFIDGYGRFDSDTADAIYDKALALIGKVTLDFADDWGKRRIACWAIAKTVVTSLDGTRSFELTVGPLKGRLFEKPARENEGDFDFFGWIGPFDEICVRGRRQISDAGVRYIWLEFHTKNRNIGSAAEQIESAAIEI